MKAKHDVCRTEDSGAQFKLTFTSGQEVEVKSQSGHLKVLASKCALLWFSISERPWKDSMHIRHENLLVLRLGEPTGDGEAGASLLSWQKTKKKHSQRGDVLSVYRSLYVNTTVRFSQLPPPVAKHHQAVLKWGRTCHFSGSLTQKLQQPEQDCSHHYCKDSSFMTL